MDFKDRLRETRMRKGLAQHELAARLHVSRGLIGQYEIGTKKPGLDMIAALSKVLGTTTDYLIRGETVNNGNVGNI